MSRTFLAVSAALIVLAAACGGNGEKTGPSPSVGSPTQPPGADEACMPARAHVSEDTDQTIISGAVARAYILHIPASYDGARRTPLVLLFHGPASTATGISSYADFGSLADRTGFIVVTPQGTGDPASWNVALNPSLSDDLMLTKDLLDTAERDLCIDATMVFVAGYSTGGGMAMRAACEMSDRIAGVGVVGATTPACAAPVPLVAFHGIADPIVPFEGGPNAPERGGGTFLPVRRIVSEWARTLGCDALPTISRPSTEVELSTYHRCEHGDGETLLYSIVGGGHTWPGAADEIQGGLVGSTTHQIDATMVMWDFFVAHSLVR